MVNTDDFIKRLEIILDYYGMNASAFADKIGVQRSSLSHLLSGRNKPSLDFILKILDVYPEIDLYWILNGKGNFPKTNSNSPEKETGTTSTPIHTSIDTVSNTNKDLFSETHSETINPNKIDKKKPNSFPSFDENIEKIVFFYKDGTFKTYKPNS